ncbi:thiolase family protein [Nocardia sp. NPDC019395]|uniref:thiolase family protein n=1 Tax=Nocardia sp. NPDC019395 TaxID=3154686 RepID=UPI0033CDC10F
MTDAFVISAAMLPMGKHLSSGYAGLAAPPARQAVLDAGVERGDIDAVFCGHAFGGMLTGQRIAKELGLGSIPIVNTDNACSGGATALHLAQKSIAAGEHEIVLVIGVDKLTQFGGGTLPLVAEDPEVRQGMVMPAVYAMRARRYLYERKAEPADLAQVSVKARRHGVLNPYAQFQKEVDVEKVLSSRVIADPLTLLQCCPTGDGAAAVMVVSEKVFRTMNRPGMRISASVLHSGTATSGARNMLRPEISYHSAREAYAQAGITAADLDTVELHDAFSIAELVYYEALGLCPEGESLELLRSGETTFGGSVVVNPSGGLLSKGHPVGASGVAQVVEMFWQLTGAAGERQVPDAKIALTHVTGGGISGFDHGACAVHIFERAD